jgi:hypothetical protein
MFQNKMAPPGTGEHQEQTEKCEKRDRRMSCVSLRTAKLLEGEQEEEILKEGKT